MPTSEPLRRRIHRVAIVAGGLAAAAAAVFFGVYGAILVYTALTFDEEGSLGHVGMYIAAFLFPLLFLFFTGAAWLAASRYRTLRQDRGM